MLANQHTYVLAYMHKFIYKNKPPHYPIDHRQWENYIHSGYFYKRLFKSTTTQSCSRPQQLTLCRSLHAEALEANVSEGLAQGHWRGGWSDSTNVPPCTHEY